MRLRARAWPSGKITTGIVVQAEVVDGLRCGKRAPVCVTINPLTYLSSGASAAGEFMVAVSGLREGGSEG